MQTINSINNTLSELLLLDTGVVPSPNPNGLTLYNVGGQIKTIDPAGVVNTPVANHIEVSFTASTSVTKTHNFGYFPVCQVVDSAGTVFIPQVTHTNNNTLTASWNNATTGTLIIE